MCPFERLLELPTLVPFTLLFQGTNVALLFRLCYTSRLFCLRNAGMLSNQCYLVKMEDKSIIISQEVVCLGISGGLPVTVQPGCLLPLPSLHRCVLRRGEVCFRQLRPRQAQRLSEHHGELPQPETRSRRDLNAFMLC